MWDILQYDFMTNAILAGLLASVACGIMGSLVVVNRIVFLSGGIAHAAYGGIGLAFYAGFSPTLGAALFSLLSAAIMAFLTIEGTHRSDTVIGVLWALGMAIGVLLIDLSPGYHVDLMSYLFGSILAVPAGDIQIMLPMDIGIVLVVGIFYKEFIAISYDKEFAFVVGVPVRALTLCLLMMTALSIVMVIRVVGLILVIALLTIPPSIAEKVTRSLARMMLLSSLLAMGFTLTGLALSYALDLTSGATIILVSGAAFFLFQGIQRVRNSTPARDKG